MYHQPVGPLAATGIGSGTAAFFTDGPWVWIFVFIAVFTLLGALGALFRIFPVQSFMYRQPKQLAPQRRPVRRHR